jgi:hypothetical protein
VTADDQPFVDAWPLRDEDLSKIPAPLDIERARPRLARRFNKSLPKQVEIGLAWQEHDRVRRIPDPSQKGTQHD